jgi:hypothetical protein
MPPAVIIVPLQKHSSGLSVSIPRLGEDLELTCKQQIGLFVVEWIAPDETAIGHRVAGWHLDIRRERAR